MENTSPMDAIATPSNEAEQPMSMVAHAIETLKASEEPKAPDAASSSSNREEKKDYVEMDEEENEKQEEKKENEKEEEKKEEKKKTMADFGYYFNEEGKMRTIEVNYYIFCNSYFTYPTKYHHSSRFYLFLRLY